MSKNIIINISEVKMQYFIYKYVQNNNIIYIGKTNNLKRRFYEHSQESKFKILNNYKIYYFECNNEIEMNSFEYFLIIKYHPPLNDTFKNINILNVFINDNNWQEFIINESNEEYNNHSFIYKEKKSIKESFIPYDNQIMLEPDDNFISITDFCIIKKISTQSVYKCISQKKKWYKYIRVNSFSNRYEIHKNALNIPTQKELLNN